MIRKIPIIDQQKLDSQLGKQVVILLNVFATKTNEVIDVINDIQKEREAERFEIQEWIGIIESVRESVNTHKKQIGELQTEVNKMAQNLNFAQPEVKENVQDKFAEQRKWVGKLCFFWGDNKEDTCYGILGDIIEYTDTPFEAKDYAFWYEHCEPVKPDDDIIYKGE